MAEFQVARSPWGPDDEIGALNLITPDRRSSALAQVDGSRVFDLSVDYFVGMPTWSSLGDPGFQIWMTHDPRGDVVTNPLGLPEEANRYTSYSGDAVSLYTHSGTTSTHSTTSAATGRSGTASRPTSTSATGPGTSAASTRCLPSSAAACS